MDNLTHKYAFLHFILFCVQTWVAIEPSSPLFSDLSLQNSENGAFYIFHSINRPFKVTTDKKNNKKKTKKKPTKKNNNKQTKKKNNKKNNNKKKKNKKKKNKKKTKTKKKNKQKKNNKKTKKQQSFFKLCQLAFQY